MAHRIRLWAIVPCLMGCFSEPLPPVRLPAPPAAVPVQLTVGRPAAVETPGLPPPPRIDPAAPPVCEDGEQAVPGFWDFYGEWCWVAPFCARLPVGYAYVAPDYTESNYVRAHLIEDEEAGRLRPLRVRLVHPPGTVLREVSGALRPEVRDPDPRPEPGNFLRPPLLSGGRPPIYSAALPSLPAPQPSVEQCLAQATARRKRQDPECAQVLGGEIRLR